jgi:serine/threonine protein kinase/tetratricopeptide (TPR) repeat protein
MTDRPREPPPSEPATKTAPPGEAAQPERRIGPYRVLRELGHGGMGTVYLAARADDQYQKRVAIKVVRGLDSAEVIRHFRRERQILAGLDHPNIARLLDGGTTDDGLPYFVMEHVEGEPIDRFCDERRLTVHERLGLFRGVCEAVQHAHRNLVVHRDLKPGNIFVTRDGVPKLMDFGIAKLLNPDVVGDAPTATGLAMTPEYASPEQARGGTITTATDVYSLGVVLYELLTGHRPYRLRTREPLEVLKAVCEEEPERPSTAVGRTEERTLVDGTTQAMTAETVSRTREGTPDRLRRRLRGDLDNIVLMALRKEPPRRYGSVEALSEDIRRYLEGRPVTAHKATAWYRASKFVRRNAVGVAAGTALLLLAVGFGVTMAVLSARVATERDRAEKEAARASAINAFLLDTLGSANPFEGRGRDTTVLEALRAAAAKLETAFPGQPDVEARVRYTIGLTYLRLGQYADAEPMLRSGIRLMADRYGQDHPDLPPALTALGVLRQERGDLVEAESLYRRALATARRLRTGAEPGQDETDIRANLALLLQEQNRLVEAEALMREILARDRKALPAEHVDVAIDLNNLGKLLVHRGRFAESEPLLREAVFLLEKANNAGLAPALGNLGEALTAGGRAAEAEPVLARAVTLGADRLGEKSQDLAKVRVKYGECLLELKRYQEAEEQVLSAMPTLRGSLGDGHEWTQRAIRLLVDIYRASGRLDDAAPYLALLAKSGNT